MSESRPPRRLPDPKDLPAARRADAGAGAEGGRRRRRGAGARRHRARGQGAPRRDGADQGGGQPRARAARAQGQRARRVTYTSDFSPAAMERFARETVELAALAEPDPAGELPAREEMAREVPELDLWDEAVLALDVAEGMRRARLGEAAARKLDARITNSDGAVFGRSVGASAFATSAGFSGSTRGTHVSFAVEPICDDADGKKRNGVYWTRVALRARRCAIPRQIGLEAARRTLAKLGSRKIPTGEAPVVFSPEAGRGLRRPARRRACRAARVWRRSTYLAEREGTPVASPLVRDGRRSAACGAGPARAPTTARGSRAAPTCSSRAAMLRTFLCDVYAARKLGRRSTGSAARGIGGGPHVGDLEPDPARRPHARRRARAARPRPLRHRSDGLRLQRRHRRLLAGRGRLLDRARRARLPGHARSPSPRTSTSCGSGSTPSATISTPARRSSARPSASSEMMIAGS